MITLGDKCGKNINEPNFASCPLQGKYGKNKPMNWIFLSPHFDDVALSCGGLVWELQQRGDAVSIWTICAGDPPPGELSTFAHSLHARWQTPIEAVRLRRREDRASCRAMGAKHRHFNIPDCIYRPGGEKGVYYYASEEALFGELHPDETPLIHSLKDMLQKHLVQGARVVCPLAIGGHVDHRLTRAAAEKLSVERWYYPDYPYVIRIADALEPLKSASWCSQVFPISEQGVTAWQAAVAAHRSQLSTFWDDLEAMRVAIRLYWQIEGGVRLWKSV